MQFLKSVPARTLTAFLLLHALVFYGLSREEVPPPHRPLRELPAVIGDWKLVREGVVEKEILDVLKADDVLTRHYQSANTKAFANLYIAYFESQRTGVSPHSPKNCIPGSGWLPITSDMVNIPVPGREEPIRVNRYVISKGDRTSAVLYWYQSRDRVIASEYAARIYLVADAVRHNRTDTALVRVIVPVAGDDGQAAGAAARQFVQDSFPHISELLPD